MKHFNKAQKIDTFYCKFCLEAENSWNPQSRDAKQTLFLVAGSHRLWVKYDQITEEIMWWGWLQQQEHGLVIYKLSSPLLFF